MRVSATRCGWHAVFVILFSAALPGCSMARLSYNHSDWLLLRKIDAYLDLSTEQTTTTWQHLSQRLEAHRRDELPAYLDYLRQTRSMVADGLSPREAEWIVAQGRTLAETTLARTVPAIVVPLSDLSQGQIRHLEKHFEKVNRNFRRKYLPPSDAERFRRSVQRTSRRVEHWTGLLSDDQRRRVVELRRAFPEIKGDWLSYNISKQRRLLALLKDGASAQTLTDFLMDWWVALEGRGPSLEQKMDETLDGLTRLTVGVDASLQSSQRRFLLWRLDNYIALIEELIEARRS